MKDPADSAGRAAGGGVSPLLEARHVSKRFGELLANDDVSLTVLPGQIHALLGENGAGKSTLVKILYGALEPTAGEILWQGRPVRIESPAAARTLGIGMVFQHFSLFEALTVAENIALAVRGPFALGPLSEKIARISSDYGLPLNPSATVADLSVGERQRIEIVRCLLQEPRLIIMDEPTAVLTPLEAEGLFSTLNRLSGEGCAVLYISHRLEEVQRLCHHATILRHGKVVAADVDPARETAASLARMMVGSDIHVVKAAGVAPSGEALLTLDQLSLEPDGPFAVRLDGIDLDVKAGEVVAIAGVAGNGQTELFAALSGERAATRAEGVRLNGKPVGTLGITERRKLGVAFVPEERLGHGAVPGFTLSENVILTRHADDAKLVRHRMIDRTEAHAIASRVCKAFDVRRLKDDPEARALSGGNLQKFVVGRELDRKPSVLVVNQPTWGVDAGAAAVIRQALIDLARSGSAVLVISQDLDEIFEIADRIAVISRGELSKAYPARDLDTEQIGLLMAGAHERRRAGATVEEPHAARA
ncbi:MAG: ABC transporter ATP-binding protein [Hyphomicrobiales bacterium]